MTAPSSPTLEQLQMRLESAVISTFARFRSDYGDDHLYGFALSFSYPPQVQCAFATEERLTKYAQRYCLSRDQTLTPELLSMQRSELRWSHIRDGWLIYDLTEASWMQSLTEAEPILNASEATMVDLCLNTLGSLDQKQVFGAGADRRQVTIGVTADHNPEQFLQSAVQLNPKEVTDQLIR